MAAGKDYREELTAKLIEQLEAGTAPWQKPWDGRSRLPHNASTDKPYRGVNSLYLSLVATARGYEDPRWATYRQAAEQGWQVRKGEKGIGIEYWKRTESQAIRDANGAPVRGSDGKTVIQEIALARPRVFYATVFNLQQMEGAPEPAQRAYAWDPLDRAEKILHASGARIVHDQGDRAFYALGLDAIHLPARDQFKDQAAYYGTALHELGHWSGHPTRLNRDLSGAFGSPSYSREELRAELASHFLSDQLGIPHDPGHHASYVQSWIQVLSGDKNEIFRAARDAEQITEYVIALDRERPKAQELTPHAARAQAFEKLAEHEALSQHPELKSLYEGFHNLEQGLNARFPNDAVSRDKYLVAVRTHIVQRLEAGEILVARAARKEAANTEQRLSPRPLSSQASLDQDR